MLIRTFNYSIDEMENSFTEKNENVHFLAGLCLYLEKRGIGLGFHNCSNFSSGCPNSSYSSETIYTCKTEF